MVLKPQHSTSKILSHIDLSRAQVRKAEAKLIPRSSSKCVSDSLGKESMVAKAEKERMRQGGRHTRESPSSSSLSCHRCAVELQAPVGRGSSGEEGELPRRSGKGSYTGNGRKRELPWARSGHPAAPPPLRPALSLLRSASSRLQSPLRPGIVAEKDASTFQIRPKPLAIHACTRFRARRYFDPPMSVVGRATKGDRGAGGGVAEGGGLWLVEKGKGRERGEMKSEEREWVGPTIK
uniref:Uncharacterized protein n=1 Tax=Oryza glumipatula TaxID=40148 RepID=A0A0E0B2N7_9ORYZ